MPSDVTHGSIHRQNRQTDVACGAFSSPLCRCTYAVGDEMFFNDTMTGDDGSGNGGGVGDLWI